MASPNRDRFHFYRIIASSKRSTEFFELIKFIRPVFTSAPHVCLTSISDNHCEVVRTTRTEYMLFILVLVFLRQPFVYLLGISLIHALFHSIIVTMAKFTFESFTPRINSSLFGNGQGMSWTTFNPRYFLSSFYEVFYLFWEYLPFFFGILY